MSMLTSAFSTKIVKTQIIWKNQSYSNPTLKPQKMIFLISKDLLTADLLRFQTCNFLY